MSLSAQDLKTYEAYKKAMKAAGGHIGHDTPFCIYSDVQLPDSSKKLHTLKPFLVVGTPASTIAPLLKELQGGKQLSASGVCSVEGGKISLEAKSGTVNFGLFKSQATTFKDLLGKEILIPGAGGAGADAKTATGPVPTATISRVG